MFQVFACAHFAHLSGHLRIDLTTACSKLTGFSMRCPTWSLLLLTCACAGSPAQTAPAVGGAAGMQAGGAGNAGESDQGGSGATADDDPDPQLSEADWQRLRELSPSELPPPPCGCDESVG
jgi:hypothetical protein